MRTRPLIASLAAPLVWTLAASAPAASQSAPEEGEGVAAKELAAEASARAQESGAPGVGTIEMVVDGERRMFEVREGSPREGFSTGYSVQPRGEAMVVGASLHGWDRDSDAEAVLSVAFWRESLRHMCDPFANQLRALGRRLRPGDEPSETCPPPDEGRGGLAVHINLTDASVDEETGTVYVAGTFSGPLGRGDEALQVTEGRFEGTLRPYEELDGSH